jgi:hypothetical protein
MAPLPELITDLGWRMLEDLPPFLREDPDVRGVIHCYAKETERVEGAITDVGLQFNPLTATELGMPFWEVLLKLPESPPGTLLEVRRERVIDRYEALDGDPSIRNWIERVTARLGTGAWTWLENTPDPQSMRIGVPYESGTAIWEKALVILREETPSEQALSFVETDTLLWDSGTFDGPDGWL